MAGNETEKADITFFQPDLLEYNEGNAYLKGYRCKKCSYLNFPKLIVCPNCWGDDFKVVRLSTVGNLYSVTDIFVGQAGMATPYVFGYVDLPEGLRIFAQLEGEPGSFACDEEVELTVGEIRKNKDGLPLISYKFRKRQNSSSMSASSMNRLFETWHTVSD